MPDSIEKPDSITGKPGGPIKGPEETQIGQGQEQQSAFKMPEPGGVNKASSPSPMEVAGQNNTARIPPEELAGHIKQVQQSLQDANTKLNDPEIQNQLTQEHYQALSQVSNQMNGDLKTIAKSSGGTFEPPAQDPSSKSPSQVMEWINGSQNTMTGALNYLSGAQSPDIASYMKMQYAVQRASQRAELFSSIVSSSVSGLKTLMSTQLG